ncbi:M48 family metallopeptidase [Accumulibacter sp.]|uniref:M48 family metallopeptidase n=1 Tax=Accumulibacter sp. TaxID=2053492 RepID=UPI0025CB8AE0|nr:M48 family metallopeptidase [Accumulibacter sp.]MCM8595861.1 M48 family metallopeptidase [Accumulibacter sp.]MCM8626582.1 M48 family metallopeptidase [Accumulibacter sp.]MDS4050009.1 M48 family metallopeptidase [Accumulibacter sp.]
MKRRDLLAGGAACWACSLVHSAWAQTPADLDYAMPDRLTQPDPASDEGGLWALMDREERSLRRSPFAVRDGGLKAYVQDVACRLGGDHCPDLRIHLVRTPVFNATMSPNGMMQLWTGLLLRIENEAQLAAVVGHEIGHYLQRHTVDRLRDIKARSAFGQFLGLFGLAGAVGQLAVLASAFAYSRDHEREADRIGAILMHQAGYDVAEASRVWGNLLDELKARGQDPELISPLFATHPAPPERRETLAAYAAALPGGSAGDAAYETGTGRFLDEWLDDEVKRAQYAETLVLLSRLLTRRSGQGVIHLHRGDVYRLRGEKGDVDLAMADYQAAIRSADAPPRAYRGIGLTARQLGQKTEAVAALSRYLELAPDAPDARLIGTYVAELR